MKEISGDECFDILDKKEYILFYFGASWCGPCQEVLPHLENLIQKYDETVIQFYKIDIDKEENKKICSVCKIKSVPAFLLFKERIFLNRTKGNDIPVITQMIDEIINPPQSPLQSPPQKEEKKEIKVNPFEANKKIFDKKKLFQ